MAPDITFLELPLSTVPLGEREGGKKEKEKPKTKANKTNPIKPNDKTNKQTKNQKASVNQAQWCTPGVPQGCKTFAIR